MQIAILLFTQILQSFALSGTKDEDKMTFIRENRALNNLLGYV
jgi:hypothetical protein